MFKTRCVAPFQYLFITLIWTWVFWFGAVLTGLHFLEFPTVLLSLAGFAGPLIVAVLMVKTGYWDDTVKNFLRNCFDPRQLSLRWFFYTLGLVLILVVTPVLITAAVSDKTLDELINFTPGFILLPGVLAGALEEPGWRGYAQKALQRRMSALGSGLVIGVFWALWHWPLFFLEGYYHATLGFGSPAFWFFNLSLLPGAVIYAWLYNRAGRVAIVAVLFHAFSNLGRIILEVEDTGIAIMGIDASGLIQFSVEAGLAVIIVLSAWKLMIRKQARPEDSL